MIFSIYLSFLSLFIPLSIFLHVYPFFILKALLLLTLIQGEDMMEDEGIHQDEEDEVAYKGRSNSSR